ncbi:rab11 family-interacting protein 3-like [Empidonax traillii]|uniref:rab11 family-interacting protein 3-like n=1 Tax=Empidonax traillii TaxID=164674 RepID=UPI000FFD4BDB|nr:rab11 family-interacting protein 3-like [Empidonax traillii]
MEPRPPGTESPLPRGPGPGPEPELDLELEPELDLWALEPAGAGPGPPPWCPGEPGGSPVPGGPAEPPPDEEPRLRPVFDALDRDGDGFVRVEEFVQFATAYGAEQVSSGLRPPRHGTNPLPPVPPGLGTALAIAHRAGGPVVPPLVVTVARVRGSGPRRSLCCPQGHRLHRPPRCRRR